MERKMSEEGLLCVYPSILGARLSVEATHEGGHRHDEGDNSCYSRLY